MDTPPIMYDTPIKFKNEIESIQNKPLKNILSNYSTFSAYMANIYSVLECGTPYSARDTRNDFIGVRTWRYN